MKHEGLFKHRLSREANNPREAAFAKQWHQENNEKENRRLLNNLVPIRTQRDATVAATVIQWLGSDVGMGFLRDVIKACPEVREHLKHSVETP